MGKFASILFVHNCLYPVGGIETLLSRVIPEMAGKGVRVGLLLLNHSHDDDDLLLKVKPCASVVKYSSRLRLTSILTVQMEDKYDAIFACGWRSFIQGLLIKNKFMPDSHLLVGVYHPREFCWDKESFSYGQRLVRQLFLDFPKENIVFMNEPCRNTHQDRLKIDFSASPIVPLSVDLSRYQTVKKQRNAAKGKIVSVGRLVDFKSYVFTLLPVIASLVKKGINVEYHIYGDGPERQKLENLIQQRGLSDCVYVHGTLPYSKFGEVMKDAWLFVGMGTALIEASACGVTCLTAIESCMESKTFGFFHKQVGFCVGEAEEKNPKINMLDSISELLSFTPEKYLALCNQSVDRARVFDVTVTVDLLCNVIACSSSSTPSLNIYQRFFESFDSILWKVVNQFGISTPLSNRYLDKC